MAITLVGSSGIAGGATDGADVTLTFSTGAAQSGDIALVMNTNPRTGTVGTVTSSAGTSYTKLGATIENGNLSTTLWYRQLTSSETTATCSGTADSSDGHTCACIVFRAFSPYLSLIENSTVGTSSQPDSPSVVVSHSGDAVISAVASLDATASVTAPTSFVNLCSTAATDNRSTTTAMSWVTATSGGADDPTAYSSFTSAAWVARTITLRSTDPYVPFDLNNTTYPSYINVPIPMIGY